MATCASFAPVCRLAACSLKKTKLFYCSLLTTFQTNSQMTSKQMPGCFALKPLCKKVGFSSFAHFQTTCLPAYTCASFIASAKRAINSLFVVPSKSREIVGSPAAGEGTTLASVSSSYTFAQGPLPTMESPAIGRVTISCFLGAGTYGRVYSALTSHGAKVAVKVERNWHRQTRRQYQCCAAFIGELFAACAYIQHESVTQVLDIFLNRAYFSRFTVVLSLSEGKELLEFAGLLEGTQTLKVAADLVSGLSHLHDRSFVHRDVKPENVHFSPHINKAILLDLGALRPSGTRALVSGTAQYMAPESVNCLWHNVHPALDAWSTGSTLASVILGTHVREFDRTMLPCYIATSARTLDSLMRRIVLDICVDMLRRDVQDRLLCTQARRALLLPRQRRGAPWLRQNSGRALASCNACEWV